MSKKPMTTKAEAEKAVKDIRRATRKIHSAEEKIVRRRMIWNRRPEFGLEGSGSVG